MAEYTIRLWDSHGNYRLERIMAKDRWRAVEGVMKRFRAQAKRSGTAFYPAKIEVSLSGV